MMHLGWQKTVDLPPHLGTKTLNNQRMKGKSMLEPLHHVTLFCVVFFPPQPLEFLKPSLRLPKNKVQRSRSNVLYSGRWVELQSSATELRRAESTFYGLSFSTRAGSGLVSCGLYSFRGYCRSVVCVLFLPSVRRISIKQRFV